MKTFRMRGTGEVVTEQEYRAQHPNISFPTDLVPLDADVTELAQPDTIEEVTTPRQALIEMVNAMPDADVERMMSIASVLNRAPLS